MSDNEKSAEMLKQILNEIKNLDQRLTNMENGFILIKKDIESLDSSMGEIEGSISSINDTVSSIEVNISSLALESLNDL